MSATVCDEPKEKRRFRDRDRDRKAAREGERRREEGDHVKGAAP